jgi:hypothetical protein
MLLVGREMSWLSAGRLHSVVVLFKSTIESPPVRPAPTYLVSKHLTLVEHVLLIVLFILSKVILKSLKVHLFANKGVLITLHLPGMLTSKQIQKHLPCILDFRRSCAAGSDRSCCTLNLRTGRCSTCYYASTCSSGPDQSTVCLSTLGSCIGRVFQNFSRTNCNQAGCRPARHYTTTQSPFVAAFHRATPLPYHSIWAIRILLHPSSCLAWRACPGLGSPRFENSRKSCYNNRLLTLKCSFRFACRRICRLYRARCWLRCCSNSGPSYGTCLSRD